MIEVSEIDKLKTFAAWISSIPGGGYYLFWEYGTPFDPPWPVIRYRPMPCTPPGDNVCFITREMLTGEEETLKGIVLTAINEYESDLKSDSIKESIRTEQYWVAYHSKRLNNLKVALESLNRKAETALLKSQSMEE